MPTIYSEDMVDIVEIAWSLDAPYTRLNTPGVVERLNLRQLLNYQLITRAKPFTITDSITVSDSVSEETDRGKADALAVTQTIVANRDSVKSVSDMLTINQYVNAWIDSKGYNFVDPGIISYIGTLTAGKIQLVGTNTIYLRKPDFGDKDSYEAFRVQRNSAGGDLQILGDPMWPTTEILDFKFSYLTQTEAATLQQFYTDNLGKQIDLYDQYGRHWKGFILTPEEPIVQDKRVGWSAGFKFQGTLQ